MNLSPNIAWCSNEANRASPSWPGVAKLAHEQAAQCQQWPTVRQHQTWHSLNDSKRPEPKPKYAKAAAPKEPNESILKVAWFVD
jgi:hypothetical protein